MNSTVAAFWGLRYVLNDPKAKCAHLPTRLEVVTFLISMFRQAIADEIQEVLESEQIEKSESGFVKFNFDSLQKLHVRAFLSLSSSYCLVLPFTDAFMNFTVCRISDERGAAHFIC